MVTVRMFLGSRVGERSSDCACKSRASGGQMCMHACGQLHGWDKLFLLDATSRCLINHEAKLAATLLGGGPPGQTDIDIGAAFGA